MVAAVGTDIIRGEYLPLELVECDGVSVYRYADNIVIGNIVKTGGSNPVVTHGAPQIG
jgi:hypothetical protein